MSESYQVGPNQITITEPDGPGFFHVSRADGDVTIGCSTADSATRCLELVAAAARDRPGADLGDNLTETARMIVQLDPSTGSSDPIVELPVVSHGIGPVSDIVFSRFPSFVSVRVDVGKWSWQWDDLRSPRWPDRRAFGGLVDQSYITSLLGVVALVGDRWVQRDIRRLTNQAQEFLGFGRLR